MLVHHAAKSDEFARRIMGRWKHGPIEEIDDPQAVVNKVNASRDPHTEGKRYLLLQKFPSRFIKPCQGITETALCCNYHIINFSQNCNLECTYCILQSYLNNPLLVQFTNIDDLMHEIDLMTRRSPGKAFRIGTGELTDSLAMDPLTGLSSYLAEVFRYQPQCALELKTKTNHVDNLLAMDDPPKNLILAWSLNALEVSTREELKTATIEERLEAARKVQEKGFQVAFHFDPMVHHPGWEENYRSLVKRLFDVVDPEKRIAWISIGSFRFPREMKDTIRKRFPNSKITTGEFVPGMDGKMRYFMPLRVEMYQKMIGWLDEASPNLTKYLCMESPDVWRQVYADMPRDDDALASRLEHSCGCESKTAGGCSA